MIKLKNVSKFYYSKGVVASGFSKVNLELELGEFVVITGESGSGKSTLLNVISGLDSYEEGEMYINGEETSHYTEKDFEEYRRKYIGNIFQNFNLVNSYTVYQNIELVLLINGYKKDEVREKILEIIRQVELTKYRNTKVSKLSGGQKQRVAIARALAKDTPIIVADEPTGNLDSRSAESVVETLYEISKNKLVVIVTHNYEQFEKYATRKIKMHDGKVLEDKKIKKSKDVKKVKESIHKEITFWNKLRLGLRNTFNVVPKFLLLLVVYLFVSLAVISEYSTIKKQEYETSKMGYNYYFTNTSDKRIVINKPDKSIFTDEDYLNIEKLNNVDKIIKDDLLLDSSVSLSSDYFYFPGYAKSMDQIPGKLDVGRMPENDYEIVIEVTKNNYNFNGGNTDALNNEYMLQNNGTYSEILESKVKIVGIIYTKNDDLMYDNSNFYVSDKAMSEIRRSNNENYSTTTSIINDKMFTSYDYSSMYKLTPSSKVPKGTIVISSDMDYNCKKFKCKNSYMNVKVSNIYFTEDLNFKVSNTYTKKTFKKYTGYSNYDMSNGQYYINTEDYYNIYNKGNYQSSVFIEDVRKANETIKDLKDLGFKTLYIKDAIVNPYGDANKFSTLFLTVFLGVVTIGLFFIAYFIIKIILKSRNIYFSTIRILGSSKKTANVLLNIELFTVFNIAFVTIISFILLVANQIIKIAYVEDLIKYLELKDYLALYGILFVISFLITQRYSKKLFKSSAMNTYREEV